MELSSDSFVTRLSLKRLSYSGMREVQISVRGSSAELVQDVPPGGRQLQGGETRPAFLHAGSLRQDAPVRAQIPVSRKGRLLARLLSPVTAQGAVCGALLQQPVQTQAALQEHNRLRPVLRRVMIQRQSVRLGERHELLRREAAETVALVLRGCH